MTYRPPWKLRLFVVLLVMAVPVATRGWWVPALGWSLVSDASIERPDIIIIENLDSNYLLFEKARNLKRDGTNARVLVPVAAAGNDPEKPGLVAQGITDVMIRVARLDGVELLPISESEPITLNLARQVGDYLRGSEGKTVLILTSGFKSRRVHLVFSSVLGKAGIETYCLPVWGAHRPENWAETWHGIQELLLQLVKLGYYKMLFMVKR